MENVDELHPIHIATNLFHRLTIDCLLEHLALICYHYLVEFHCGMAVDHLMDVKIISCNMTSLQRLLSDHIILNHKELLQVV